MQRSNLEQQALDAFESGFHCAEAIFSTITDHFPMDLPPEAVRCTSAFCGGIGKCQQEVCGALSGGVAAIGALFGRTAPGEDFERAWQIAAEFRRRFEAAFGATRCGHLLEGFGDQKEMVACKQLTAQAAGILYDLICEKER